MIPGGSADLLLGGDGYQINNSLRFRSSASAYLSRTFGAAGSQTTWTFSLWYKRGLLKQSSYPDIFSTNGISPNQNNFRWNADDTLVFYIQSSATTRAYLQTTQVFRDPTAWYHIVLTIDTTNSNSTDRLRLYINGNRVTAFSSTVYPTQNQILPYYNGAVTHWLGSSNSTAGFNDGYMAEVYFVDGQSLTASSFGQTDPATGVWMPIKYSGTYGTNGFYLPFSNIATTSGSNAGLGKDFSGNGNYWTTNNISVTAGSTYDAMIDSPTNAVTGTQPVGNYAVLNPTIPASYGGPLSDGNLKFSLSVGAGNASATIGVLSTGKWYYEQQYVSGNGYGVGIQPGSQVGTNNGYGGTNSIVCYACESTNRIYNNGSVTQTFSSITASDVLGVAFDCDAKTVTFYKNGVQLGTTETITTTTGVGVYVGNGSGTQSAVGTINFGQRPFAYTPPSGFKALCTSNLPAPTIGATSSMQANKFVDATLYTGSGSTQSIVNTGAFQPDFVWLKGRSLVSNHRLFDSARGIGAALVTNGTGAEFTDTTSMSAFNSNGFSVGTCASIGTNDINASGSTYVGWQWKAGGAGVSNTAGSITSTVSANPTVGFSIVKVTLSGSAPFNFGHGLGTAPSMFIAKRQDGTSPLNWHVYHKSMAASPQNGRLLLNLTDAYTVDAGAFGNTAPTSTVIYLGNNFSASTNVILYCWAEVTGFSKFGSYTGNGSTDGPFVYCGFRPRWIMFKRYDAGAEHWNIFDTSRSSYNQAKDLLYANLSNAEASASAIDFLSNGFKSRDNGSGYNTSGASYIFAAFAESPFNYSRAR